MALLRNAVNPPRFAYFCERLEARREFTRAHELVPHVDVARHERHGLSAHEFVGLSPAMHPRAAWRALLAFERFALGRANFGHLGNNITLARSQDLSLSYMGFAARAAHQEGTAT